MSLVLQEFGHKPHRNFGPVNSQGITKAIIVISHPERDMTD